MSSTSLSLSSLPLLLSSNSSAIYSLPLTDSPSHLQLTLNLCAAPVGYDESSNTTFTAYTNGTHTYSSTLHGGFGNITVYALSEGDQASGLNDQLRIQLETEGAGGGSGYSFQLGITEYPQDPWHIINKTPLFAYEDSDNANALLTSPTYPAALLSEPPTYQPLISLTSAVRSDLSSSACYLANLTSSLVSNADINTTTTKRGVTELSVQEGGRINETSRDGTRLQYAVGGLTSASNYSVWALEANSNVTAGGAGGNRLYTRQYFATKSTDTCRLLFDAPFCPALAYSVPAPPGLSTSDLLSLYNDSISPSLFAFTRTLSTFPCDDPLRTKQGMFSHVRTCANCLDAYTAWVCATRMPRCTDEPGSNPGDSSGISSNNSIVPTFRRTEANDSRTPFLPQEAFPYSELPPCIDVCNVVEASCPPLISNAFQCPLPDITLSSSYNLPLKLESKSRGSASDGPQYVLGNIVQGGDDPSWVTHTLEQGHDLSRAKDRWGNVWCNDMGSILLVQRRRWSGRITSNLASSAAPRRTRGRSCRIGLVLATVAFLHMLVI